MIRAGASYALVELLFQVENQTAREALEALGIFPEDGQVLCPERSLTDAASAKSTARLVR